MKMMLGLLSVLVLLGGGQVVGAQGQVECPCWTKEELSLLVEERCQDTQWDCRLISENNGNVHAVLQCVDTSAEPHTVTYFAQTNAELGQCDSPEGSAFGSRSEIAMCSNSILAICGQMGRTPSTPFK